MSKNSNLSYQFLTAINNSFKPGMDKHSIKHIEGASDKIYSYANRKDLVEFSHQLSTWIKENYGDVKLIRDIKVNYITNFLKQKSMTCSKKTIQQYSARIDKLEKICEKKYNLKNINWHNKELPITQTTSIRNVAFSSKNMDTIINYIKNKKDCDAKNAIYIAKDFGVRVNEITNLKVKDFNFETMNLKVSSSGAKGGRVRYIPISQNNVKELKSILKNKEPNDRVIPIKNDSINHYLRNCCKKLDIKDILESKSGIHAIRKYFAREKYKEFLSKGFTSEQAARKVMVILGHSENRMDLRHIYLNL